MKARLVVAALGLALTGCTGTPATPPTPATSLPTGSSGPTATSTTTTGTTTGTATTGTSQAPSTSPTARATTLRVLTLGGTAIGDRPLGSTPQDRLDPDLVARLGKPRVGPTQLCRLAGDRSRFAVVDHSFGGLTVHYGRRGEATIAIGWEVALDRVPDGFRLADRLPWHPTFAALAASGGVDVESRAGVKTARLTARAISYTGDVGAAGPDTVHGGPELVCQ